MGQPISNGLSLLATAYGMVITIAGGYLTAWLAPNRRLAHAVALGIIGIVAATAGAAATWNLQPSCLHGHSALLRASCRPSVSGSSHSGPAERC